ncbi:hypothetical protein KI387_020401, partial [Taxus chinensis]
PDHLGLIVSGGKRKCKRSAMGTILLFPISMHPQRHPHPRCKPNCINALNLFKSKQSTLQFGFTNCKHQHHLGTTAAISHSPSPILQGNYIQINHENGLGFTDNGSVRESHKEEESSMDISAPLFKEEISRRRNFAIISHPDAGKTTLTEKLLLYGGAIHEAGAVKARRAARHATSDWMELEKQRGISITSTALVFETKDKKITLLDTPGHQ